MTSSASSRPTRCAASRHTSGWALRIAAASASRSPSRAATSWRVSSSTSSDVTGRPRPVGGRAAPAGDPGKRRRRPSVGRGRRIGRRRSLGGAAGGRRSAAVEDGAWLPGGSDRRRRSVGGHRSGVRSAQAVALVPGAQRGDGDAETARHGAWAQAVGIPRFRVPSRQVASIGESEVGRGPNAYRDHAVHPRSSRAR